jgi:hypothetical protein
MGVAKCGRPWYGPVPQRARANPRQDEDDMDEAIASDGARMNGTEAVRDVGGTETSAETGRDEAPVNAAHVALTPSFLAGLATAMRETAIRERDRISGVVAEDAAAHVEKVRSRAAIETEELRRLAEEDVEHIEQWREGEIARIKEEASQRIDDRRSSLDEYLKQHDAIIETEIQGVDGAVKEYEATLDRFFAELSAETDPSAIVRRAGQLPTPPDLDEIRASARASAMARLADADTGTPSESNAAAEPAEAVAEQDAEPTLIGAAASETAETVAAAERIEPGESTEPPESTEATEREATLAEDRSPVESEAVPMGQPDETPAVADPAAGPVGVMDPDAQRVPNWPEPAPRAEAAPIAPTMDNTSAAVRLLRSVAPWTAPTHAGNRGESESD